MEDLLAKIAAQSPALLVLAYLVYVHSKSNAEKQKRWLDQMAKRDGVLKVISDGCHEVQRDAIEALRENSRVLGGITVVLQKMNGGTP